jgi:hypothetical protein
MRQKGGPTQAQRRVVLWASACSQCGILHPNAEYLLIQLASAAPTALVGGRVLFVVWSLIRVPLLLHLKGIVNLGNIQFARKRNQISMENISVLQQVIWPNHPSLHLSQSHLR